MIIVQLFCFNAQLPHFERHFQPSLLGWQKLFLFQVRMDPLLNIFVLMPQYFQPFTAISAFSINLMKIEFP